MRFARYRLELAQRAAIAVTLVCSVAACIALRPMAMGSDRHCLCEKLIKIGARVVSHGRCVTFQMAEVAVSRQMFAEILSLIAQLRAPPARA